MDFATRALHAGMDSTRWGGASVMPIMASAAFGANNAQQLENLFAGRAPGHVYGRLTNPTVTALERRWASLEEGSRGNVAFSTGMAGISALFSTLVESGEEIISSSSLFGGTRAYFDHILSRSGVKVHYVSPDDPAILKQTISKKTRALFLEALGNPRMDVPEISQWAKIAREASLPLVLDTTLVTPALIQSRAWDVSITVQSGTKFLTGNGTVLSGSITDCGTYDWSTFPGSFLQQFVNRAGKDLALTVALRQVARQNMGASLSPFDAYIAMLGADTLDLRMTRHSQNALALALFLQKRTDVPQVSFVGLEQSPWHKRAHKYFQGRWGGLLTFRVGSKERAYQVLNHLHLARIQTNLGDARTLALHPASTIHRNQDAEEKKRSGVTEDLIRVSVGLESSKDIIADFENALDEAKE